MKQGMSEGVLSSPPSSPMTALNTQQPRTSLDTQHAEFLDNRFLAMPIAGAVAWTAIGIAGALLPITLAVWAVFIGTGMIFYLGIGIARLTGEDLLGRQRKGNFFDQIFL